MGDSSLRSFSELPNASYMRGGDRFSLGKLWPPGIVAAVAVWLGCGVGSENRFMRIKLPFW